MNLAKPPKRGPKPRKAIKRGSRPSRVRKTASGRAKHAADIAWAKAVKAKHPTCTFRLYCAGAPTVDAAHVFGKGAYPRLRAVLANGVGACRTCHEFYDHVMTPGQRKTWAILYLGQHVVDGLMLFHLNGILRTEEGTA